MARAGPRLSGLVLLSHLSLFPGLCSKVTFSEVFTDD